jgi:hypothetical protein
MSQASGEMTRPGREERTELAMSAARKLNLLARLATASVLLFVLAAAPGAAADLNVGALVIVNSQSADYEDFPRFIEPYLVQFGVPYEVRDLARDGMGNNIDNYSLIIIGHRGLALSRRFLTAEQQEQLLAAIRSGTGLVSFDGLVAAWKDREPLPLYPFVQEIFGLSFRAPEEAATITIGASVLAPAAVPLTHYITASAPVPRTVMLKRPLPALGLVPGAQTQVLAFVGNQPLLVSATYGQGRAVLWASYEWTKPEVKGKLYGLEALVWRGLVWAARKPFLLRGMPHYLALRVDDVAGFGLGANRHLGHVAVANRYGLKPWLGIFIDDLRADPEATRALARYTQQGLATASVHARRWHSFFFLDEPLLTDGGGRNIAGQDWPDEVMARNFAEAEKFFTEHGIAPSKLMIPHFYEFGTNNFAGLKRWGTEFVSTVLEPGRGYGTPMLRAGPFLIHEPPRASNVPEPVFIADWLHVPGYPEFDHQFFNFVEEMRDVTGYEWAPSGVPVEEAIRRGVVECQREFDSLLPAVLFTHESDHLQHLQPEEWDGILAGVTKGLEAYQPIPVTLDFLAQYLRALRTSRLVKARYDPHSRTGTMELAGDADVATKFYVFKSPEENPTAREWEAPPFHGKTVVEWQGEPSR